MTTTPQTWTQRLCASLDALAARPTLLLAVLLAAQALARPYAHLIHDAQLYGVQVLNRVEAGAYDDDLFLRYGSQDDYSLFSRLATPLASLVGVPTAFFLLYVVCDVLFVFAALRFVQALIPDRLVATLALLYIAVTPLPFGGLGGLHVHEAFLTPRLVANALVLFGLERALHGRWGWAFACMVAAGAMHPLMAMGGLFAALGLAGVGWLGWRRFAVVTVLLAVVALVLLLVEPWGIAVLGYLDPEWRQVVVQATPLFVPSEWTTRDWLNVAVSFGVLAGCVACWRGAEPRRADGAGVLLLVGVIGLAGSIAACVFPYALLLQGQPFRVFWLLKLTQAPAAFYLARQLWARYPDAGPYLALALLAYFGLTSPMLLELVFPLLVWGVVFWIGRARGWPAWRTFAVSLVLGFSAWTAYRVALMVLFGRELIELFGLVDYGYVLQENVGPVVWLAALLPLLVCLHQADRLKPALALAALALFLAIQTASFTLRVNYRHQRTDLAFVATYLVADSSAARNGEGLPTVYWPLGRVQDIWVGLRAKSYFETFQLSGVLFQPGTAAEGQRRARLTAPFELERLRGLQGFLAAHQRRSLAALFARDFASPPPDAHDLLRLCQDGALDYVILPKDFAGLSCASNGSVFIYDCNQVRALSANRPAAVEVAGGPFGWRGAAAR